MDFTEQLHGRSPSQEGDLIQIRKADVPRYLQQCAFYRSLDASINEELAFYSRSFVWMRMLRHPVIYSKF